MIRINLLPFRAAKKRENIKRQISIYVLTVVLLFCAVAYMFMDLDRELTQTKTREQNLRQEVAVFEKTLKQIAELEKKIKEIKVKLEVIRNLEKKKVGPVHLLDEIAMAVPREKLWLNLLSESGGLLTLKGTAMDNETVALFMTNLEKSEYIQSVNLKQAKSEDLPAQRLRVSQFWLECKTYAYEEKAKPRK